MKTWFISDLHLNHTNIIKYCNRPFETVEEMNEWIIKQWNKKIKKDDIVWLLGDVSLGNKEKSLHLLQQLNGKIHMIYGNHDHLPTSFYYQAGFKFVSKYPVILKNKFILSHAPMVLDPNSQFINIHGHVHKLTQIHEGEALYTVDDKHINVCADLNGLTPQELNIFNNY